MNTNLFTLIAAWVAVVGCSGMALFQFSLALGAPLGAAAWGGKYKRLPEKLRVGSLFAVGIFVFGAICILEKANILVLLQTQRTVSLVIWILAIVFALSAIANVMSPSKVERRTMTPIAIILSVSCFIVALGL